MSSAVDGFVRVGTMSQLRVRGCLKVPIEKETIAVFYHNGKVNAVHNRCPHSGYALETGSIKDGVVTCIWHQARFDLATGESFDQELAEHIYTYAVEVRDGEVWVNPEPQPLFEDD